MYADAKFESIIKRTSKTTCNNDIDNERGQNEIVQTARGLRKREGVETQSLEVVVVEVEAVAVAAAVVVSDDVVPPEAGSPWRWNFLLAHYWDGMRGRGF